MDKETKNILKILGVAMVVLFIFKPKSQKNTKNSKINLRNSVSKAESKSKDKDLEFENAVISIKAFRSAINNNEPQSVLDKLNRATLQDFGIKVFNKKGKLFARNTKGNDVANEK